MFRFHTTQANASISASIREKKNFDPYACAYACAYACVASENQAQSSQVSRIERETHANKFNLTLPRGNYYFSRI